MNKLSEQFPRQSKIEFEKYNTKITLEFIWGIWDKEKWVSLTWSATKITILKPYWEKVVWIIDFGMFQWWKNDLKYNEILPFELDKIKFVIATHLDHIGKMLHLSKDAKVIINHWTKSPEQLTFWLAIKWIIWRTKEVLFADFNEKLYLEN